MKRENKKVLLALLATLLSSAQLLQAAEEVPLAVVTESPQVQAAPQLPRVGERTAGILELQRSGLAAGREQPVSGEVASRSYQRYLESFSQPLAAGSGTATKPATASGSSTPR